LVLKRKVPRGIGAGGDRTQILFYSKGKIQPRTSHEGPEGV